jgi:hypothetical protein
MVHRKLLRVATSLLILAGLSPFRDTPTRAAQGSVPQSGAPQSGVPQSGAADGWAAEVPPGEWRSAPEYVRLFTPLHAHTESYRAYVSQRGLDDVLRGLEIDPLLHPPGAWAPSAVLSSEAFGLTGTYDRAKLARLYGARRAIVARGPRGERGRPTQAWTLISPYPDRNFDRLQPGTLLIVLNLRSP